jgi:hypothetical protein
MSAVPPPKDPLGIHQWAASYGVFRYRWPVLVVAAAGAAESDPIGGLAVGEEDCESRDGQNKSTDAGGGGVGVGQIDAGGAIG